MECPLDFFKTEPFISEPLLSAIGNNNNHSRHAIPQPKSAMNLKRSYDVNSASSTTNTHDFTRELVHQTPELDKHIRLASIGLVARNIFKDIVIRPIKGLAKLMLTAGDVLEKNQSSMKKQRR